MLVIITPDGMDHQVDEVSLTEHAVPYIEVWTAADDEPLQFLISPLDIERNHENLLGFYDAWDAFPGHHWMVGESTEIDAVFKLAEGLML